MARFYGGRISTIRESRRRDGRPAFCRLQYLKPRAARSCSDKKHPLSPGPSGRPRCRHSSRWLCVCPQPDGGQRGPATGHCRAGRRRRGVERLVKAPALAVRLLERLQRAGKQPLVQALVHLVVEAAQPAQGSVRGASSARRGGRQRRTAGAPLAQGLVVGRVRLDRVLGEHLTDLRKARALRGAHNGQNAAAAFAACEWLDIPHDVIGAGIASFPGLAHRLEEVGHIGSVVFINDSKATNADAAEKALLSFDEIFWIIGGKSKEGGIEPLRPLFPKVRKAYLIGAASDDFARTLGKDVPFEHCGTLEIATQRAAADAAKHAARESVVLLSPACASYDQFANFEVRGQAFRTFVGALAAPVTGN